MAAAAYTEKHFRAQKHPTARDPLIRDNEWRGINSSIGLRRERKTRTLKLYCVYEMTFSFCNQEGKTNTRCAHVASRSWNANSNRVELNSKMSTNGYLLSSMLSNHVYGKCNQVSFKLVQIKCRCFGAATANTEPPLFARSMIGTPSRVSGSSCSSTSSMKSSPLNTNCSRTNAVIKWSQKFKILILRALSLN